MTDVNFTDKKKRESPALTSLSPQGQSFRNLLISSDFRAITYDPLFTSFFEADNATKQDLTIT